jgi:hypothetical protein
MADVNINKSRGKRFIGGVTPSIPSYPDGTVPPVVNPPGTIGGPSNFISLTDTPANYTGSANKFPRVNGTPDALIFDTISPFDLDQEGATDGQVLTWVSANSKYEPVTPSGGGSSLWTDATTYIYRNSPVVIGDTAWSNSTALTVKGNATASSWVLKVQDSAGSNLIALLNDQRLYIYSQNIMLGNNPANATGINFKSTGNTTQNVLSLQDSSANILFSILANGQTALRTDRFNIGSSTSSSLTGVTIKVPGTGFTKGLEIQDSSQNIVTNLYANGSIVTIGTRNGFGIVAGVINNGSHFQGVGTSTAEIFVVQNGSAQRALEIRGNRQIIMAGLPTSNPGVTGSLWNDSGDLKIS